jgi:hypothetical protein
MKFTIALALLLVSASGAVFTELQLNDIVEKTKDICELCRC